MMSLNRLRRAVPSSLPFMGATTDRKAAAATESSSLSGCMTDQGALAAGFLRMLGCIYFFQITFLEAANRREKRRDALPPRMARLSKSFNSELRKMRCLEFMARSRRRYG